MAQSGFTPIQIYSSSTASAAPAAGNLTNSTLGSELAINITDGKLFYKDNGGSVQVIGWKTVPTTAGGTGLTSYTAGDLVYYASGTAFTKLAIGAADYVMTSSGTAPQWSQFLKAVAGGTGQTSYAVGDILYANTTTTLAKLADVATGNALISGGVGVAPSWGKIGLTTHVSGVLPVANGGTNASSASITAFNNITGYTASGATGTTSTNLVFSTSPTLTTPKATTTIGVGNATPSASGSGITFPATQDASTNANTLDDYEEGTWTPTITAYSGTLTTTSSSDANYTRVGNVVTFSVVLTVTNNGTGAGYLIFTLPFSGSKGYASAIGINTSSGVTVSGSSDSSNPSTMYMQKTDGTYPIASGQSLRVTGTYLV